jgi:NADH:ubiquinone oxidoreductase subunit F (NADH-binding)
VSCLGRCQIAPAVAVDDRPARTSAAADVVESARAGIRDDVTLPEPRRWPNDPYDDGAPRYQVLRELLSGRRTAEEVTAALTDAGLRGMGGAGFPTGRKWSLVAGQAARPRYAVCNADESEPGTFKDRQILADQPHLVLEGLLLGMAAVGAEEGWVFVRHEYGPETEVVRAEIERLRAEGLLGDDVLGSGRRLSVEVFVSPGGYILGEESALLECLEGHRGEPRNKPPFPGVHGLWGQPTLINSVETFADVPVIVSRGAQWWRDQGDGESVGLKFFAVSGHVERPGLYEVPFGFNLRDLLERAGARPPKAVLLGGAAGSFLRPDQLDLPLTFEGARAAGATLGSGVVIVYDESADLVDAVLRIAEFFRDESCGQCVPCRVGTVRQEEALHRLASRNTNGNEIVVLSELAQVMRDASICGLGQTAANAVESAIANL